MLRRAVLLVNWIFVVSGSSKQAFCCSGCHSNLSNLVVVLDGSPRYESARGKKQGGRPVCRLSYENRQA